MEIKLLWDKIECITLKTLNLTQMPLNNHTALFNVGVAVLISTILLWRFGPQFSSSQDDVDASLNHNIKNSKNKVKGNESMEKINARFEAEQISQGFRQTIEICLSDIESIRNAIQGGANSIEICVDRMQGGITPSLGLIEEATRICTGVDIEIHVLIRPRPGLFSYTSSEFDCIIRDILTAKSAGVSGVVIGILNKDGSIDVPRMKIIRNISQGLILTFHRAFDVCTQPMVESLDTLIDLGCTRLLTSGRRPSACEGIDSLIEIVNHVNGQMQIIAAAGVNSENVFKLISETNIDGVHAGSSVTSVCNDVHMTMSSSSSSQISRNSRRQGNDIEEEEEAEQKEIEKSCVSPFPSVKMGLQNKKQNSVSPEPMAMTTDEEDILISSENSSNVNSKTSSPMADCDSTEKKPNSGLDQDDLVFIASSSESWDCVDRTKVSALVIEADNAWKRKSRNL